MDRDTSHRWGLAAIGVLIVGLSVYVVVLGDLTAAITGFLATFALQFALYAAAITLIVRLRRSNRWNLMIIFVVAIASRAVLIGSAPTLSNDIYRYLWEGRVIAAGFNPFGHAPDAPELEFLRDANYEAINHKHLETIYPPAAQAAFVAAAVTDNGIVAQKLVFTLFDLGTMLLVVLWLRARRRRVELCAIYGWSPLVILEFAHSGHMDSLGIFFLVLAALLIERRRRATGLVALAMSCLAKYLSLALLPFFAFKRRYWTVLPVFAIVVFAGYLPFAGASAKLVSSLGVYGRHWNFNSLLFSSLTRLSMTPDAVRLAVLLTTALFAVYQGHRQSDFGRFAFLVVACGLVLSPTVYPWYLCWVVPFLCIYASWGWLFLSGAVVLSYTVWNRYAATGLWEVPTWVMAIEYVPFLALLSVDAYRRYRAEQPRWGFGG